jgi:hypothetical protein
LRYQLVVCINILPNNLAGNLCFPYLGTPIMKHTSYIVKRFDVAEAVLHPSSQSFLSVSTLVVLIRGIFSCRHDTIF